MSNKETLLVCVHQATCQGGPQTRLWSRPGGLSHARLLTDCSAVLSSFLSHNRAKLLLRGLSPDMFVITRRLSMYLWIILWTPCNRDWVRLGTCDWDNVFVQRGGLRCQHSTWRADPLIKLATMLHLLLCHSESVWSGGGQNVQALQIAANYY